MKQLAYYLVLSFCGLTISHGVCYAQCQSPPGEFQGDSISVGINSQESTTMITTPFLGSYFLVFHDGVAPLTVDTMGSVFDTEIALYDLNGNILEENDDFGGTLQSSITMQDLPPSYYVVAVGLFDTTFAPNFFVVSNSNLLVPISLNVSTSDQPTTVDSIEVSGYGNEVISTGTIPQAQPQDCILDVDYGNLNIVELDYEGSSPLTISAEVNGGNSRIALFDANGNLLAESVATQIPKLEMTDLVSGNYYVAVGRDPTDFVDKFPMAMLGFNLDGGDYTLTFETGSIPITATSSPMGANFNETLEEFIDVGDVKFFEINYDGLEDLSIETISGPDTELGLYDADGDLVDIDDDSGVGTLSRMEFTDLPAGTYFLAAGGFDIIFTAANFLTDASFSDNGGTFVIQIETAGVLLGDVNLDGEVDLLDVQSFVEIISLSGFQAEADINQDGVVSLLDVAPFVSILTGG